MRIHELRATAFGPFPDEVSVDFDALTAQGIFLIHGPTGAGKTSLLDAICFALFADVPGMRDRRGIVSDHAAPGVVPSVELEFTCGTRRFRLHRQPAHTRPKKRGTGHIEAPATVSLAEQRDGEWSVLSTRNDETAEVLDDVIGMGKEQFAKVAMLPQGEFAAFLTAKDDDRRALLEKLFDITRFADVEDWLVSQRRATEADVSALHSAIDTDLARLGDVMAASGIDEPDVEASTDLEDSPALDPRSPDGLRSRIRLMGTALDAQLSEAMATLEAALASDATAAQEVEAARVVLSHRSRAASATATLATLEEASGSVAATRATVEVARRAGALRGHTDTVDRAAAEAAQTAQRLSERAAELASAWGGNPPASASTSPMTLVEQLGAHDDTVRAIRRIGEAHQRRQRDAVALGRTLAAAQLVLKGADTDRDRATETLQHAQEQVASARDADASLAGLEAAAARAEDLRLLATRVVAAADQIPAMVEAAAAARTQAQDARDHEQELVARRLAQMAAELAEGLADGAACPVCGAHDHPQPAESGDRVSAAELDEARAQHARLVSLQHAAEERATAARARVDEALSTLSVRSLADLDVDALTRAEHEAATAVADVRARAAALASVERDLAGARTALAQIDIRVQQAHTDLARVGALVEQARDAEAEDLRDLADLLETHEQCPCSTIPPGRSRPRVAGAPHSDQPGGDPGSALVDAFDGAALAALGRAHAAATTAATSWAAASETHAGAVERLSLAQDNAEAAAVEIGFEGLDEARASLIPVGELERLSDSVRDHDRKAAAARAVLDDEAVVAALHGEAPDLDALASRAAVARSELLAAQSAQAQTTNARTTFASVRSSLLRGLDAAGPALERHHRIKELADTFSGGGINNTLRMRLTSYVLAARLDTVAQLANERLRIMGGGRYALEHTDRLAARGARSGLGLRVLDQWTGATRETSSLSGGEAFMASLALALGLADAVREESGGFDLGTLFVDEGFGTLDDESLEEVVAVLDALREGGRAVGVVSHVGELRSRIASQLVVRKSARGSSVAISTPGAESAA